MFDLKCLGGTVRVPRMSFKGVLRSGSIIPLERSGTEVHGTPRSLFQGVLFPTFNVQLPQIERSSWKAPRTNVVLVLTGLQRMAHGRRAGLVVRSWGRI